MSNKQKMILFFILGLLIGSILMFKYMQLIVKSERDYSQKITRYYKNYKENCKKPVDM